MLSYKALLKSLLVGASLLKLLPPLKNLLKITAMRSDFPLLANVPDLVYLDSAATALKPTPVLEAELSYSTHYGANASRGLYPLAEETSLAIDDARQTVADFIGSNKENIIFTSGTTAAINMLARSLETAFPKSQEKGEIIVSIDAHHSQILPWQELATRKGWNLSISPVTKEGHIDPQALIDQVSENTKVVALTLVSNVYGVINDLTPTITSIRSKNPACFILIDAAQAVAHIPVSVTDLGADALVFSGHKLYGPTGIGVCSLTQAWQQKLEPSRFGGGMVQDTSVRPTQWKEGPEKFEAGTLPLAQIFGLKKAIEYITSMGRPLIKTQAGALLEYALQSLVPEF